MTVADLNRLAGVEKAMALDEFDAQGIDRLVEDEIPQAEVQAAFEGPDFDDVPDYMHGIGSF